jgi:hypothetical protein
MLLQADTQKSLLFVSKASSNCISRWVLSKLDLKSAEDVRDDSPLRSNSAKQVKNVKIILVDPHIAMVVPGLVCDQESNRERLPQGFEVYMPSFSLHPPHCSIMLHAPSSRHWRKVTVWMVRPSLRNDRLAKINRKCLNTNSHKLADIRCELIRFWIGWTCCCVLERLLHWVWFHVKGTAGSNCMWWRKKKRNVLQKSELRMHQFKFPSRTVW